MSELNLEDPKAVEAAVEALIKDNSKEELMIMCAEKKLPQLGNKTQLASRYLGLEVELEEKSPEGDEEAEAPAPSLDDEDEEEAEITPEMEERILAKLAGEGKEIPGMTYIPASRAKDNPTVERVTNMTKVDKHGTKLVLVKLKAEFC